MNKNEALISIIVPVYNVEPYIHKCIDSIVSQTYRNLEIILVDDGSPDRCGEICDDYAKLDSRIRVIHKANGGLSDARNAGLDIATGQYIGFVDSDDWIEQDMFEYLITSMTEEKCQISVCNVRKVTDHHIEFPNYDRKVLSRNEVLAALFDDRIENYAWNKLYETSLWETVRFPVGQNFEDVLTIYKTVEKATSIVLLPRPKYNYLIRSNSISGTRDYLNRKHIYKAFCDRYEEAAPRYPEHRAALIFRIRRYYINELCAEMIKDKKNRNLNQDLVDYLAGFMTKHRDELFETVIIDTTERDMINAFCKGTLQGCEEAYALWGKVKPTLCRQLDEHRRV